jgi:hypothetical protein
MERFPGDGAVLEAGCRVRFARFYHSFIKLQAAAGGCLQRLFAGGGWRQIAGGSWRLFADGNTSQATFYFHSKHVFDG